MQLHVFVKVVASYHNIIKLYSENVQILVTLLKKQNLVSQHFKTRELLAIELARVCPLSSLIRFGECI